MHPLSISVGDKDEFLKGLDSADHRWEKGYAKNGKGKS
jgi:hypothetical protein